VQRRRYRRIRLGRDVVLCVVGVGLLGQQALLAAHTEPALVAAAVALILSPAASRVDAATEKREVDRHDVDS
jgi:hypothetical protein